jgi:hypothetical protein
MKYTDLTSQGDFPVRVVTLANLIAMCERGSGITHTYEVVGKPSEYRARVVYSNPDEYGSEAYVVFSLPVYTNPFEAANPYVVLTVVSARGGRHEFDRQCAHQAFDAAVLSADALFRTAPKAADWQTADEIKAAQADDYDHAAEQAAVDEQIRQGREIDNDAERGL